ncbi:MAG: hypothetical protein ACREV1_07240 [Gammaproteobacteria bacterium]
MTADALISRLDGVRVAGSNRWIVRCPAHEGRTPSLSVRDDDGVVLLHCFAGCSVDDVISAIGLELSDLFPPRESCGGPRSPEVSPGEVLAMLHSEALILLLAGQAMENGANLSKDDHRRLSSAVERIRDAAEYIGCTLPSKVNWEAIEGATERSV